MHTVGRCTAWAAVHCVWPCSRAARRPASRRTTATATCSVAASAACSDAPGCEGAAAPLALGGAWAGAPAAPRLAETHEVFEGLGARCWLHEWRDEWAADEGDGVCERGCGVRPSSMSMSISSRGTALRGGGCGAVRERRRAASRKSSSSSMSTGGWPPAPLWGSRGQPSSSLIACGCARHGGRGATPATARPATGSLAWSAPRVGQETNGSLFTMHATRTK